MTHKEAYNTLRIKPLEDYTVARSIYREAVRIAHPDKGGDSKSFIRVQEAWAIVEPLIRAKVPLEQPKPTITMEWDIFDIRNGRGNLEQAFRDIARKHYQQGKQAEDNHKRRTTRVHLVLDGGDYFRKLIKLDNSGWGVHVTSWIKYSLDTDRLVYLYQYDSEYFDKVLPHSEWIIGISEAYVFDGMPSNPEVVKPLRVRKKA